MEDEKLFNYKRQRVHPEDYEEVRHKKKKEKEPVKKHIHDFIGIEKEKKKFSYFNYFQCTICGKETWRFPKSMIDRLKTLHEKSLL